MKNSSVVISCENPKYLLRAKALSQDTQIPISTLLDEFHFALEVSETLGLRALKDPRLSPLVVDFKNGALDFRRRFGNKGGQLIVRAVGGAGKKVLDCTAGLAKDTFILASFDCQIKAFEKSFVVGALARDALMRAFADERLKKICERIDYNVGNSLEYLKNINSGEYDAIYMDPMFEKKSKSALPKKDLRVLQYLFEAEEGESSEEAAKHLLSLARTKCRRVVVKRPLRGKPLDEGTSVEFKGSSTRFDVYDS